MRKDGARPVAGTGRARGEPPGRGAARVRGHRGTGQEAGAAGGEKGDDFGDFPWLGRPAEQGGAAICAIVSSSMAVLDISVPVGPGDMVLTRTPDGLNSAAHVRVSDSSAAFVAA